EEDEEERPDELGHVRRPFAVFHNGPLSGRWTQARSAAAILCRRAGGRALARADVERPARLALAAHVPADVDARARPRPEADAAGKVAPPRPPVERPRARIVEVLVDHRVGRVRVDAIDEDEVDAPALLHDVLLRARGGLHVAVEALVGA